MAQLSVLLVEDDEMLRGLYKEAFHRNGFKVVEADNGQTAVDLALINRPSIIILDLMMPKQGGIGMLRVLRSLPECKMVPVIILTALPNPEYKAQAEPLVQGYYQKTEIKPKDLVAKARQLIGE